MLNIYKICTRLSKVTSGAITKRRCLGSNSILPKHRRLEDIDTFVFDCDGVIWKGNQLIAGARLAIDDLRSLNKKLFFVTNNSTKSRDGLIEKFRGMGILVDRDEVLTSSFAAALYLKRMKFLERKQNKAYVIGDVGIVDELTRVGIQTVGGPAHRDSTVKFTEHFHVDPEIGAVVVGLDTGLNYYKLQYSQLLLNQNKDCLFVATNRDPQFPNKTQLWPGAGCVVAAVVGCTGREPVLVGKPSSVLIDYLIEERSCSLERMCMVGDRLETDILFGQNHGMLTCLTMSGVTNEIMLNDPNNKIIPDIIVDSIADIPRLLCSTSVS